MTTVGNQVRDTFQFNILKLPLQGPDNLRTPHYGLFRSDTGDCLPVSVSSRFVPHTTEDVAVMAEAASAGFGIPADRVTVRASWFKTGHRVCVRPDKELRRSIHGSNDNIWPSLLIRADYGAAFTSSLSVFRDACKNLMMLRKVEGTTVSIAHRGNFRDEFDSLVGQFTYLAARFDSVVDVIHKLDDRKVAIADFLTHLYPVPEETSKSIVTRHREKMQSLLSRLADERIKTGRDNPNDFAGEASLWEMVNVVTGFVQHDSQVRGKLSKVERAFRAADSRDCDKAWELAVTMAS